VITRYYALLFEGENPDSAAFGHFWEFAGKEAVGSKYHPFGLEGFL
jgi:hypothetical protein